MRNGDLFAMLADEMLSPMEFIKTAANAFFAKIEKALDSILQ